MEDTTAAYGISLITNSLTNGTHTLTATARDTSGNTTTSTSVTVTVSNSTPDTTSPTVSITSPTNLSTVSGSINITANASDNVGVAGVQFRLDGVNFGSEDQTAAYGINWDTTTATNGSHVITAIARDAAGNTTTATNVTVTVSNT
ncbi:hypothetical protein KW790_02315, partial [Candidatus Parcubacteria bacterium]|nr:hypothetical protein [Candidatus Parcubacteria bacterium]